MVLGDPGITYADERTITGFGSVLINQPLSRTWPVGTTVRVFATEIDFSKAPRITIYQLYNFTYYCRPPHVHSVANPATPVFASATITRGTLPMQVRSLLVGLGVFPVPQPLSHHPAPS